MAKKPAKTSTASTTRKRASVKSSATKAKTNKLVNRHAAKKPTKVKIIKHHAKSLYHMTPKFIHGMIAGAFVGVVLVSSLGLGHSAEALTISAAKDCDSYSIIYCGVQSTADIKSAAKNNYVAAVYKYFTISATDISDIGKTAVKGTVYDNGSVKVGGKLVATDAITAARKRVTSQDKQITSDGATFFRRHLKTYWSHTSAPAYVVFKSSGAFDYAIIATCGNPIIATNAVTITTPTPTPTTPTTPTTTPTTPTTPTTNSTTPTPTVPTQTETTPQTTSTPVATIKTLPNTGPGAVLIVLLLSVLGGAIFHRTHHHVRHKRRMARG